MITTNLKFNFQDIFRSPRIALSGKKIFVFIQGNLFGFIAYWICSYLSLLLSGYPIEITLEKYGLYPCLFGNNAEWYSWVIYFFGIYVWLNTIFLCSTAVSRITLKQLKGNDFFSGNDAWCYTKKHWHPVIFSPIAILFIIIIFVLTAGFFAILSHIPILGELLFSLPYFIYFFGSVFTLYTFVVLVISLIYTPSIVGLYEEDTMGTVFHSYSIAFGQNWRIILYHFILIPLVIIGMEIFSWFCLNTIGFINYIFGYEWFNNLKLINISNHASSLVYPVWFSDIIYCFKEYIYSWMNINSNLPQLFPVTIINPTISSLSFSESFSAIILALSYFLILLSIISYGLSIIAVGETIMFIIFKKISDDDNILNRDNEVDTEENPKIPELNHLENEKSQKNNNNIEE